MRRALCHARKGYELKPVLRDKDWFVVRSGKGLFHGGMRGFNERTTVHVTTMCGKNLGANRPRLTAERELVNCKSCKRELARTLTNE